MKNLWMKNNTYSPFLYKGKVEFHDLNYFEVDPSFVFNSNLYEYNPKDTVTVFGTKGEKRKTVRFGYLIIDKDSIDYKINVYEGKNQTNEKYYSIWFTDKTTNKTTYGVGRYLDFEKLDDPDKIYRIDFNLSYNPYCAGISCYRNFNKLVKDVDLDCVRIFLL